MGSVIMMNGGPVSWSSALGKSVAMSTCETEVNEEVVAAKDALHIRQMLMDLGFSLDTDLTRNTRAPHINPQHWLLCHMGLY